MGLNAMADDRADRVIRAAFAEASRHARRQSMAA
jgi:hypothetical protein